MHYPGRIYCQGVLLTLISSAFLAGSAHGYQLQPTVTEHPSWPTVVAITLTILATLTLIAIWNHRLQREIKARKKAESALQLAQLTLDSIPLHIFWFDKDFRVAMANKTSLERTGLSLDELHHKTVWDLDPSFDTEHRHTAWNEVKTQQTLNYIGQLKLHDGSLIPTEESLTYLETSAGQPYIVCVGADITQHNRQEEQLKEREYQLKEALIKAHESSRIKSEFLANMSHEIRTPLNAIIGYSEMLSQGDLPPNKQQYVQTIIQSGKTLIALINDILDLSKMEAGKMTIRPIAVNPRIFFKDITQIFEPRLREKELEMRISIDPHLPEVLMLDEVRLRQVLFNLLGNAVKFTQRGSVELAVTYTKTKLNLGTLTISISDTGIGIAEEDQHLIFQSFQQQSGGTSRTYGGTGLGLTISKRLIELMQGEIQLESTPDKGSCFTLILQDVPSPEDITAPQALTTLSLAALPKATILITDDIKTNRDLIEAFLEDTPVTVLSAANGREAVQIAQERQPDLILMDIKMDIMSGTEAAILLRESPTTASIPIIALSGVDPEPKLLDLFDDFIHKPFSLQVLHQKLHHFLQGGKTEPSPAPSGQAEPCDLSPLTPEEKDLLLHMVNTVNRTGNLADAQAIALKLQQHGTGYGNETLTQMGSRLSGYTEQGTIIQIERLLDELQHHLQEHP